MTYNVFSGTLNPTHFTSLQDETPIHLETEMSRPRPQPCLQLLSVQLRDLVCKSWNNNTVWSGKLYIVIWLYKLIYTEQSIKRQLNHSKQTQFTPTEHSCTDHLLLMTIPARTDTWPLTSAYVDVWWVSNDHVNPHWAFQCQQVTRRQRAAMEWRLSLGSLTLCYNSS